jgi:tRNA(fMet)-specific endonuclease VapC
VKFLLDTNAIIVALEGRSEVLRARMAECEEGDLATSAIVHAEILLGFEAGKPPLRDILAVFSQEVPVLPFDMAASEAYARIPFRRGSFDRLIAAHALALDLILVTDNTSDYDDVPGLRVENWVR